MSIDAAIRALNARHDEEIAIRLARLAWARAPHLNRPQLEALFQRELETFRTEVEQGGNHGRNKSRRVKSR